MKEAGGMTPPAWQTGAGDGNRTHDLKLGKLSLCRLSYTRALGMNIIHNRPGAANFRTVDRPVDQKGISLPLRGDF
jgi:hypothetical protein